MEQSSHFYLETSRMHDDEEENIQEIVRKFQEEARNIVRGVAIVTSAWYGRAWANIKH